MRAGGKRRLTIPPLLGYGDRDIKSSAGEVVIPANSTLVYEIELLSVE
jgi:FKBP-type peptidyl-prolyl cis-trans isomerase